MKNLQFHKERHWMWLGMLALGLTCGKLVHMAANQRDMKIPKVTDTKSTKLDRQISPSFHHLWKETAALQNADEFSDEVQRIHRESRSPLRAVSLLSFRIQNSSFEEWKELLAEGKITDTKFLGELGEHLARIDPQRALQLFFHGPYRFENLDQVYAFRDPLLRKAADTDPGMVLEQLKAMRRGGVQMDASLFFSRHWAEADPQAAATHFTDLVRLRNMTMDGSPDMPDGAFAEIIMQSWLKKAPDEARDYVLALPEGATRKALSDAVLHIPPP